MCLILTAYKAHPDFDLIVLANRDEFYTRPTEGVHWWDDDSGILAGRDLQAGGTWLGVNTEYRFSALTNYRDPSTFRSEARSRGKLVSNYLLPGQSIDNFRNSLLQHVDEFNDFNQIFFEDGRLYYFNSLDQDVVKVTPGVHGLSNHKLNTHWPKVDRGKRALEQLIDSGDLTATAAFDLLNDRSLAPDDRLPDTGIGLEKERFLSAMHIDAGGYGTRSSNVLFFSADGSIDFYEKDHLTGDSRNFKIQDN